MGHYPTTFATWEALPSQLLIELLRRDDEPGESLPYEGIEPYIYVSYAHRDRDRVFPILQALKKDGYRTWYDGAIPAGSQWVEVIAQKIKSASAFLVFCSSNSNKSEHISQEVNYAIHECRPVIPVYLDQEAKLESNPCFRLLLQKYQHINYYEHDSINSLIKKLEESPVFAMCKVDEGTSDE